MLRREEVCTIRVQLQQGRVLAQFNASKDICAAEILRTDLASRPVHRTGRRPWHGVTTGGRNPLHWAVLGDHAAIVAFLLGKGAWVEASDAHDDTPLHLAARCARALLRSPVCGRPACEMVEQPSGN